MNQRFFPKLGYTLTFLSIALLMTSCSKKDVHAPVGPEANLEEAATALAAESDFDEFKPLLEEVAKYVAERQSTVSRQVMRQNWDRTLVLSELFPEKSNIVSQVGSDGTPYEIGIEFSNRSKFSDLPARVAIDPDRFYPKRDSFVAFVITDETGKIESEIISKSVTELDHPLIIVTLEDRTEIPFEDVGKGERKVQSTKRSQVAKSTSTMYLTLSYVDLHTDHDPLTNEEFEIYIRVGSGSNDPVYSTTIHKFDGISRNDAAYNYKYYSDINSTSAYIISDIALWPLSSTPTAIAMVEDDGGAGQFKDCICEAVQIIYGQEYRHDTGLVHTNVARVHNVHSASFPNSDDVWKNGMFSNFTEANTPSATTRFDQLNDFDIDLRKHNGIPDPPPPPATAPVLGGSTAGGHPYLNWTSVSGANGYKIFRSLNGGAYTHIYTQNAGLNYIDTTRDVGTSGAYTLYKVNAYNAGGDGPFSNTVFYYTVPH